MDLDFGKLMTAKKAWNTFRGNHPQFPAFMNAVKNKGVTEGTEILITVAFPDGDIKKAGLRVKESDLEMLELLRSMMD